MGAVADAIRAELPGVFVHSIATGGGGAAGDVLSSYFGSVNDQVAAVCDQLLSIPQLKDGYVAVGFSQAGCISRLRGWSVGRPAGMQVHARLAAASDRPPPTPRRVHAAARGPNVRCPLLLVSLPCRAASSCGPWCSAASTSGPACTR